MVVQIAREKIGGSTILKFSFLELDAGLELR